jgi:peptidoglycan biosynthesis protein MviN/MurJ (putative lipid II flippase)
VILKDKRPPRLFKWLAAVTLMHAASLAAWAQCAMCKTTASNLDPGGVKYLNYATLLLVTPPVVIFCGFIYAAYKRRDPPDRDF